MIKIYMVSGVFFALALSACSKGNGHDKVLAGPMLPKMQREDLKRVAPQADSETKSEVKEEKPAKAAKATKAKARQAAKAHKQARRAAKKSDRRPASVEKAKHRKQHKAARKSRRAAHKKNTAHPAEEHSSVAAASDTLKD